ncbi:uncharacterized protein LOC131157996 isoform X1 [Malania oleifera]|uniref:uncharacterized protein LOC131157996 isoform X1 n=1 Tax=Malania oleifera TaxID=397392 RepID=UPI0025ADCFC5|nr:uncharacterized protein LOC131157996 isoform X1 [Malania oleifera]
MSKSLDEGMANFSEQLQELKALISSSSLPTKSSAYSALLHLQEQSSTDLSLVQTLAEASPTLLSSILSDVFHQDEEIAAPALKCLGFTIYHPVLVAAILEDGANEILESLAKLITTTKTKSVCNLGVWCISIQQFNASFLTANFHFLLRAVVHALDNPISSLSTTFEAIQLSAQLSEEMRDASNIWAPPIYRRLVSVDKRERDMSERCLSKIISTIVPPPLNLSKEVALDLKQKLLPGMKELLSHGMKVQTMQAWRWFMRLLGSYAVRNRQLVNELLKIPEQTFSDHDPQVQIATQVAWEVLIDALIHSPVQVCGANAAVRNCVQQVATSVGNSSEIQVDMLSKSIKLIMTPLIGIMSSKCDLSVHSSCLNTWCYLLHKLDTCVNYPVVMENVVAPIFEAVFGMGPGSKSIWLWNLCLDMLGDCLLAKCRDVDFNQGSNHMSARTTLFGPPTSGYSWKNYPVKWLPWDLSRLDFYIKMVHIIHLKSVATIPSENRGMASDAALRIFRSILKGVKIDLKNPSTCYDEIMLCLNTLLRFIKEICEVTSEGTSLHHTSLQFVEAVTEELEPSVLGCPLYKVELDLECISSLQPINDTRHMKVQGINFIAHMDAVSPIVHLTVLYFSVLVKSFRAHKVDFVLQGVHRFTKLLVCSFNSLEPFHTVIDLMYRNMEYSWLEVWAVVAKAIEDYMDSVKDLRKLKAGSHSSSYSTVCLLLSYPFVVFTCPPKRLTSVKPTGSSDLSLASSPNKLELECVIEVWKSLYHSVNCSSQSVCSTGNSFPEDLSSVLNGFLDENISMLECGTETDSSNKNQYLDFPYQLGDAVLCVLEQILILKGSAGEKGNSSNSDSMRIVSIRYSLGLAARFMRLSHLSKNKWADLPAGLFAMSRVFSALARLVGCLHWKHDIISFVEILSCPLLPWLSQQEIQDENTAHQLQLLWTETLNCLKRSWPPINFDSSSLRTQASLLEKTLDHPNPSISKPTISFWNSTYGEQTNLDFPQNILHVLDKLSRSGRLQLCKRSPPSLENAPSRQEVIIAPHRCKVAATHNRSSKRVELMEDAANGVEVEDNGLKRKRKRKELTEHQKEVRRAQQGRERDGDGHGPGIRTYTTVDFSQGNDDSQGSQEIRDPESILEMLRRTC